MQRATFSGGTFNTARTHARPELVGGCLAVYRLARRRRGIVRILLAAVHTRTRAYVRACVHVEA